MLVCFLNGVSTCITIYDLLAQATKQLLQILDTLDQWTVEIEPIDQPQRFGNAAFRDWHKRLCEVIVIVGMMAELTINATE